MVRLLIILNIPNTSNLTVKNLDQYKSLFSCQAPKGLLDPNNGIETKVIKLDCSELKKGDQYENASTTPTVN